MDFTPNLKYYRFLDAPNMTFKVELKDLDDGRTEARWSSMRFEPHPPIYRHSRENAEIAAIEAADYYLCKMLYEAHPHARQAAPTVAGPEWGYSAGP